MSRCTGRGSGSILVLRKAADGMTRTALNVLAIVLALPLAACAGDEEPDDPMASWDSAGVRIVYNDTLGLPVWSVADSAEVTIGVVDGEPAYTLDRVAAAFRLSDGRILVANGGTLELRYFDPRGRHLRTVGGRGSGPGEFRGFGAVRLEPGDSVLVFDIDVRRATLLDGAGNRMWTRSLADIPLPRRQLSLVGRAPDGSLALRFFADPSVHADGYTRDTVAVALVGPDSARTVDTLLLMPGFEGVKRVQNDGGWVMLGLPFAYRYFLLSWGDGFLSAFQDRYELRQVGYDGRPRLSVRLRDEPLRPVTTVMTELWLDSAQAAERRRPPSRAPDDGTRFPTPREQMDALPRDRTLPAFGDVRVDARNRLWVEDHVCSWTPADSLASNWTVFDEGGQAVARARLPRRFTLRHIAFDHVVATIRDDLEVEYVVVHRILRQPGAPGASHEESRDL